MFCLETSIYQHPLIFSRPITMVKIWVETGVTALGCNECTCFYGIGTAWSFLVYLNIYKFTLCPLLEFHHHGEVLSALLSTSFTLLDYQLLLQVGEGGLFVGKVFYIHQVLVDYNCFISQDLLLLHFVLHTAIIQ